MSLFRSFVIIPTVFFTSLGLIVRPLPLLASSPLTLDQVIESAHQHYPLIVGSQVELEKAQADQLAAQGGFDPVLKSSTLQNSFGYYQYNYTDVSVEQPIPVLGSKIYGGYRIGQGKFPAYDSRMWTFTNGEVRAGLEIPLLKGRSTDERRAKIKTSEQAVLASEEALKLQRLDVKRQATYRYWDWLAAGKKLDISAELLKISLTRDQSLADRVKHGDSAQIDRVDNQRAVVQRRSGLMSAERSLQKSAFELSLFYRDEQGNPLVVDASQLLAKIPEPEIPSAADISQTSQSTQMTFVAGENLYPLITNHPEIKRLQLLADQAQVEYSLADNLLLPKLDLYLGMSNDFGMNPGTDYTPPTSYPFEFKAGLTLEFPLLFRSARGKSKSAFASLQKVETTQRLVRDRLTTQVKDSTQAMHTASQRLVLARKEIELTLKLENAERVRYQHGDSSLFLINLREQATRDAMTKEVDALVDFHKAKADYLVSIGVI